MSQFFKPDTKEIDLTPEFITKSDLDLETIKSIFEYSRKNNFQIVITGGYATDAQLGGRITRPHGDIDCVILEHGKISNDKIFNDIQSILGSEVTKWDFSNRGLNKIDFREDNIDIPFNQRRRLEVKIPTEKWPESEYEHKVLYNSKGETIKVTVSSLYPLIREKIHKFYEVRNGIDTHKDRETSQTDIIDLAKLLQLKNIQKNQLLQHVSKEEYDYVQKLFSSLDFQPLNT